MCLDVFGFLSAQLKSTGSFLWNPRLAERTALLLDCKRPPLL